MKIVSLVVEGLEQAQQGSVQGYGRYRRHACRIPGAPNTP